MSIEMNTGNAKEFYPVKSGLIPETDIDVVVKTLYEVIIDFSPERQAEIIMTLKDKVQGHYQEIINQRRDEENFACIQLEKYMKKFNQPTKSNN